MSRTFIPAEMRKAWRERYSHCKSLQAVISASHISRRKKAKR